MSVGAARHARVKEVFLSVVELPLAEQPSALESACAGDDALRAEVQALLANTIDGPLLASEAATQPWAAAVQKLDESDPLALAGVTLDGRYRIERLVAEGGFGYVYRAEQVRWGRPVAVKVFKIESGDDALKQAFVKEGALLNDLSRQTNAIVQSYDVGSFVDGAGCPRIFIAIEWLDGRTLASLLSAERQAIAGGMPIERAMALLAPVAGALTVAHRNGIAHRDVKPSNIFLVDKDGVETSKLLDFGVAKVAAEYEGGFLTTGGKVRAFTLGYAAPEQLSKRHGSTGPWTDVYALALVLVEMLLGRRPIDLDDPVAALRAAVDPAMRPTPARLGLRLPDLVEAVFARALAIDPAVRHPDAAEFWSALEDAVRAASMPVPSVPAELPRRPFPWWALAGGLAVVAAVATWWYSAR